MKKCTKILRFMQELFDEPEQAEKAAEIGNAIMAAHSLRMTDIATKMAGNSEASYKRIQRFLKSSDPRKALWRLYA